MPTLTRSFVAFLGILLIGIVAPEARSQAHGVWLEISAAGPHIENGEVAVLPATRVPLLQVHLMRQPNEVAYSKITTWINAASANIVTTQRATDEGIICTLDLARNPGLMLHPGRNSVEVTYKDRWNEAHYASFIVQLPGEKPSIAPPHTAAAPVRGGQRYALVIGVGKYKFGGRGIQNLPYADADAGAFYKTVISPRGGNIPEANVQFLLNEDATAEKIRSAFNRIAADAKADDVILVYLNMNGSYDPQDPDRKYLLAYDSDPEDMRNSALSIASLPRLLMPADGTQHIIVLADTCHGDATETSTPDKITAANLVNLYLSRAFAVDGQAVMEASDIHQVSQAGSRWNDTGVFTHFLIDGLSGSADANHDGTVTTQELFRYVQLKVSEATVDEQLPMVAAGTGANIALAGVSTARQAH
jgi:hypothetical protein